MSDPQQTRLYYERRAVEERAAAARTEDERARASHLELARRYDEAADDGGLPKDQDDGASGLLMPEFRILN